MSRPRKLCTLEGCTRPHFGHGYCQMHYARWKSSGDPAVSTNNYNVARAFLFEKVLHHEGDECLVWPFSKTKWGYGQIGYEGHPRRVHNLVCYLIYGAPPTPKHEAAHSCNNKPCCNPRHLRWATRSENRMDMVVHGTAQRGERHNMAKLTASDVREIRKLQGTLTEEEIATRFGVTRSNINAIFRGVSWSWLKDEPTQRDYLATG